MLINYLKVAIRNLLKHKFYSFLNIFGLAIGLSICLLIFVYVASETSVDKFHDRVEDIYRVNLMGKINGQEIEVGVTCPPMAATLKREFPGVEDVTRMYRWSDVVIRQGEHVFTEEKLVLADSNFFEFFSFQLLEGNKEKVLNEPNTVVLSTSYAQKYFGNEDPIGKILTVGNDNTACKVTGIMADPPVNTRFRAKMLLSMETMEYSRNTEWLSNNFWTYFRKANKANVADIESQLDELVFKYVGPEIEQFMGVTVKQMREQGGNYGYFVEPLGDIYLHSTVAEQIGQNGDIKYIYIFVAIAIFILLLACINFMNLATARSAKRGKEVGIRKVLGAFKRRLVGQFLAESVLYSLLSMVVAFLLAAVTLPFFNQLAGKEIPFEALLNIQLILGFLAITLLTGIVSGAYPAFYLTSFQPSQTLKGTMKAGVRSGIMRNSLVVFQFVISIGLIVCTTIVFKQLEYVRNKNLGFDRENVLVIENARRLGNNKAAFMEELKKQTSINSVGVANDTPPDIRNTTVFKDRLTESDHLIAQFYVNWDFIPTMNMEIVAGRNFSRDFPSDSTAVILNEAAVKEFGLTDPIGDEVLSPDDDGIQHLKVVGVVKDFNFESLKDKVRPIAILFAKWPNRIVVRLNPGDVAANVEMIEEKWKQMASNEPFDYSFLDDDFDALFKAEQRLSQVFTTLTTLAILIACLGLFGLAAFTAEQRVKEIGIRKVLGASVASLVVLLTKEFTILVLIAFSISIPIAYFTMDKWLEDFAYRIEIGVMEFVLAGVISLVVAWLTVSYQSIKAAYSNPIKSLRSE
ncbi:ABC transporter permease [Flammeovirgaceae bacterium SG7u.111]|nr:ABC transporter permease [Flammeovirgaceae bacterium SG7u.132]WPO37104.1 ABC transporter permease [Flammeovirgaceae bacterium SG7u.111]